MVDAADGSGDMAMIEEEERQDKEGELGMLPYLVPKPHPSCPKCCKSEGMVKSRVRHC